MQTYFNMLAGIIAGLSFMIAVAAFYIGKDDKTVAFSLRRKFYSLLLLLLSFNGILQLCFEQYRGTDTEILSPIVLMAIYFMLEVCFFAFTAYNHSLVHKKLGYCIMLNYNIIVLFLLVLLNEIMDKTTHFFTYGELFAIAKANNQIFTPRLIIISMLIANAVFMAVVTVTIMMRRRYKVAIEPQEITAGGFGTTIAIWISMIGAALARNIVCSEWVCITLQILLIALIIASFLDHLLAYRRIKHIVSASTNGTIDDSELQEKISVWLASEPYPLLNNNLTMDDVASAIDTQRSTLSEYLSSHLQLSFTAWLSDNRLSRCIDQLKHTDKNLSEIAYDCGYADLPTMSKAFKRKYGFPPSKYRKFNNHEE
jgi:AraC-like DNA-binding protein